MKLGRVIGTAVSTVKAQGLNSYKLLLVREFRDEAADLPDAEADYFVAIDTVGAGIGEVVLVAHGSAARLFSHSPLEAPVDAAIVAIMDTVRIGHNAIFERK